MEQVVNGFNAILAEYQAVGAHGSDHPGQSPLAHCPRHLSSHTVLDLSAHRVARRTPRAGCWKLQGVAIDQPKPTDSCPPASNGNLHNYFTIDHRSQPAQTQQQTTQYHQQQQHTPTPDVFSSTTRHLGSLRVSPRLLFKYGHISDSCAAYTEYSMPRHKKSRDRFRKHTYYNPLNFSYRISSRKSRPSLGCALHGRSTAEYVAGRQEGCFGPLRTLGSRGSDSHGAIRGLLACFVLLFTLVSNLAEKAHCFEPTSWSNAQVWSVS
ncbi:hypothetical protein BJ166DRAFT_490524 [Pestalotiopsis sp. NC0098]|nr:hypothetical protein BJ166DRAFT_490524 [Pestalotiopsis sp. NC0098]